MLKARIVKFPNLEELFRALTQAHKHDNSRLTLPATILVLAEHGRTFIKPRLREIEFELRGMTKAVWFNWECTGGVMEKGEYTHPFTAIVNYNIEGQLVKRVDSDVDALDTKLLTDFHIEDG